MAMKKSKTPWEILGVSRFDSQATVQKKYRELCRRTHPDNGGNADEFQLIQVAYNSILEQKDKKELWFCRSLFEYEKKSKEAW